MAVDCADIYGLPMRPKTRAAHAVDLIRCEHLIGRHPNDAFHFVLRRLIRVDVVFTVTQQSCQRDDECYMRWFVTRPHFMYMQYNNTTVVHAMSSVIRFAVFRSISLMLSISLM